MPDGKKAEKRSSAQLAEMIVDVFGRKEKGTTLSPAQITRRVGLEASRDNVKKIELQASYLEQERVLISRPGVNAYALNYVHLWQDENLAIEYIRKYGEATEAPQRQSYHRTLPERRPKSWNFSPGMGSSLS